MSTSELSDNFEWVLGGFCEQNLKLKFDECEFLKFGVEFRKFQVEVWNFKVEVRKFEVIFFINFNFSLNGKFEFKIWFSNLKLD